MKTELLSSLAWLLFAVDLFRQRLDELDALQSNPNGISNTAYLNYTVFVTRKCVVYARREVLFTACWETCHLF